ncbi:MAG: TetR/AcrR family transcriptional regulator [Pseudomonadota bacterium]
MNERQIQIANAAIGLILKAGVGVSTAQIAKASGVSNGTLFNAYPTKQSLIDGAYLMIKRGMSNALSVPEDRSFTRATMRPNWDGYLTWATANPTHHKAMHVLLESGLASPDARAAADAHFAEMAMWMNDALAAGQVRGPNIEFITKLIFFHLDLVIDQNLTGADEAMAFDMLCQSIGVSQ